MTPEAQRIAIAEACGWKVAHSKGWHGREITNLVRPDGLMLPYLDGHCELKHFTRYKEFPDYLNDLNAMHEAEKVLLFSQREKYHNELRRTISNKYIIAIDGVISATPAQRAEAFLRTLGLWQD